MSIEDRFPKKPIKDPVSLVQARIRRSIYFALTQQLERDKVTMKAFVEACALEYLAEKEKKELKHG